MARRLFLLMLAVVLGWSIAPVCRAHSDLLLQIEDVSRQILNSPKDATLYLRRGELRRLHAEWDLASADYERAASLAPGLAMIDLVWGRLYLDSGWPLAARAALDRFLAGQTNSVEGFVLRARALTRLTLRLEAARDYEQAIRCSTTPGPELFIERARVLAAAGEGYIPQALQSLDEGMRVLGPLVTLQLYAIDMELQRKGFDGALARLEQVTARSPRKETWLARRGEVLKQAGRPKQAEEAFRSALAAWNLLPAVRRNVPAMQELGRRLRQELGMEQ